MRNQKNTGLRKSVSLSLIAIYICLFVHLRVELKNSKTEAARYKQSSFGEMLEDEGFLNWLRSKSFEKDSVGKLTQ